LNFNPKRILIVDDNTKIHEDFCKVLNTCLEDQSLKAAESILFGKPDDTQTPSSHEEPNYTIDSAYQGEEALELVRKSMLLDQPYALAFIDIRMPPGWDGIFTIKKLWEVDAELQVVICSAHSDYSWDAMSKQLDNSDNFLVLKKPFELIEIRQLAASLTKKWELRKRVNYQIQNLNKIVNERTESLNKSNQNLAESLSLINATLESTQEGILAVCREREIITYNKMFLRLWDINENLLKMQSPEMIFQQLAQQAEESQLFFSTLLSLYENPKKENIREWKLQSGKILELYSHPRYIDNKQVGSVFSFRDITERKKLEEQLLYQATHDSLTRLPNRILLTDRIQQAILHAKRYRMFVGILVVDLDNFKQINDSLGHNAGDILLKLVSKKLLSCVRESDTVTRLGGDEFVLVLVSLKNEEELIQKARQLVETFLVPSEIENHQLTVTVSIGISVYPKDGHDPDILLRNADAALYHAKEEGRNTFQFYRTEFNDHLLQRAELTTALRQALPHNELTLHYQPLIELNTDNIIGMEALLRWKHPTFGNVSPQVFIPLAEETGLIASIGEWVLKEACQQAKLWQKTVSPTLRIAVNVSAYQFKQKNFIDIVRSALQESTLDPSYLELEITESLIVTNSEDVLKKMSELKMMGVYLSIDDFGTGYASLSYLRYFPFDKIKIDKSFIEGVVHNTEDRSIIEAIINMTKSMGLEVLAEGVERKEQVDFLRQTPNTQVQGYYFSPALGKEECTILLEKQNAQEKAE
jgi:diguanylate cyclase (GGDEF)-like protein/PAS domain S-box-containing protein